MLSVLIPVYNYSVSALVDALVGQAHQLDVPVEIILLDDHSDQNFQNETLDRHELVSYERLPVNVGRARIRNLLAERARFPFLLFLDADATVVRNDFLRKYVNALEAKTVLCGGLVYQVDPPTNPSLRLRWHFGCQREQRSAKLRAQAPQQSFSSFNFVIPRIVFQNIRFDEGIKTYGHEDTLFGQQLHRARYTIRHLDNPLQHDGLEPAELFLHKTALAARGLYQLHQRGIALDTRLWRVFQKLQKSGTGGIVHFLLDRSESFLRQRILNRPEKLHWLDLYKIRVLLNTHHQHKKSQKL